MSELTSVQSNNNKKTDADHNDKASTLSNTSITRNKNSKSKSKVSNTPVNRQLSHTSLTINEESKVKTNGEHNVASNSTASPPATTIAATANTPKQTSLSRINSITLSSTSLYSKARLEEDGELPLTTAAGNQSSASKNVNNINTNQNVTNNNSSKDTIAKSSSQGNDGGGKVNGSIHDATLQVDSKNNKITNNKGKTTSNNHINGVSSGGSKELDNMAAMREANSIRQFKALVEDSMLAVDRSFAHEGRAPSSDEYKVRLKYTLEGIRQTIPK